MKRKSAYLLPLALALTASGAEQADKGPGAPVPDENAGKVALALLQRFAAAPVDPASHPFKAVICAPAVWKRLVAADATLAAKGARTLIVVPDLGTKKASQLEGRSFVGVKNPNDSDLYGSGAFRALAEAFSQAKPRAADQKERDLFYAMIPFEIHGQPVTILEAAGDALLLYHASGILWIDTLGDYKREKPLWEGAPEFEDSPTGAVRRMLYVLAVSKNRRQLAESILPDKDAELLLDEGLLAPRQQEDLKRLAKAAARELRPGDKITLHGGLSYTLTKDDAGEEAGMVEIEDARAAFRARRVAGTWKADAGSLIAERKKARQKAAAPGK